MNKRELAEFAAIDANVTPELAELILDSALHTIIREISSGARVTLNGFGYFAPSYRKERNGYHQDRGAVVYPAVSFPRFKPSQAFRDAVKELPVEQVILLIESYRRKKRGVK